VGDDRPTLATAQVPLEPLQALIASQGYAFVPAESMQPILASLGPLSDWPDFAASWNDLALDQYMADGGRYRRRRHATYAVGAKGAIERKPHQAHYQSLDYNPLHGGIARWFEPVAARIGEGPSMRTILGFCHALFSSLPRGRGASWHVEVHQFRIEARPALQGHPTPEGLHRDGVDYVLVLLIARQNIVSGTTGIHDFGGRSLGTFTLTHALDAALVDDTRVSHGVTPVEARDPALPAFRDVLVVTFRKEAG
jgi:hypothetical protein